MLIYFGSNLLEAQTMLSGLSLIVLAFLPGIAGLRFFARAKRFDARAAQVMLQEDKRPAVVYLRSFDADKKAAGRIGVAGFHLNTEEGELAEIVKHIGPLVAIGRPGEELPWFGAARLYVGEGDWQKRVRHLLKSAPLVILRAGSTSGLMWEIGQCARTVKPQRLLVLIPLKQRDYDEFCSRVADLFPCQLPKYQGRYIGATSLRAVLYFDEDWTPHLVPVLKEGYASWFLDKLLRGHDVLTREKSDLRAILENALEPALSRSASVLPRSPSSRR
jgi:hypothetical protein